MFLLNTVVLEWESRLESKDCKEEEKKWIQERMFYEGILFDNAHKRGIC